MPRPRKNKENSTSIPPKVKLWIGGIICFTLTFFSLLALLGKAGGAGQMIDQGAGVAFGSLRFLLPLLFLGLGFALVSGRRFYDKLIPLALLFLVALGFLHLQTPESPTLINLSSGGGYLGFLITLMLKKIMGLTAAILILSALALIALILLFHTPLGIFFKLCGGLFHSWRERYREGVAQKTALWEKRRKAMDEAAPASGQTETPASILPNFKERPLVQAMEQKSIDSTPVSSPHPASSLLMDTSGATVSELLASYKIPLDLL